MKRFTFIVMAMLLSLGAALAQTDVTFVVKDSGGEIIEGAAVTFSYNTQLADANGEVTFQAWGDGDYLVQMSGYAETIGTLVLADYVNPIEVILVDGFDVTFTVKDERDTDLDYWNITLDGIERQYRAYSDGSAITFGKVAGTYSYEISKNSYLNATGSVEVINANVHTDIVLLDNTVTFTVWNADVDTKLEGITVKFNNVEVQTDQDGIAVFSNVWNGTYSYEIHGDTYVSKKVDNVVVVDYNNVMVDATAEEGVEVIFTTVDEDGVALDAYVTINGFSNTLENGTGSFWLPSSATAMNYDYTISMNGYEGIADVASVGETTVPVNRAMNMYSIILAMIDGVGDGINEAKVVMQGVTFTADPDGVVELSAKTGMPLYGGVFNDIIIYKSGYADQVIDVDLSNQSDFTQTITMVTGYDVKFEIKEGNGAAVPEGVALTINGNTYRTKGISGVIYVGLADGTYNYEAMDDWGVAGGLEPATGEFTVAGPDMTVNVTMIRPLKYSVYVWDASNPFAFSSMSGIEVTLEGTGDNAGFTETVATTFPDPFGGGGDATFTIENTGTYDIKISHDGFTDYMESVTISETSSHNVSINPIATSIEVKEEITLNVYPNPVVDVLRIDTNANITSIAVYNLAGNQVKLVNGNGLQLINMAVFSQGIYILKIQGDNGYQKVIKIKK